MKENPVVRKNALVAALSGLIMVLLSAAPLIAADSPSWPKKTYVYKPVDHLSIELDFFRPADQAVRPLVVWIHSGALITGNRDSIPGNIGEFCEKEGFAL